MRHALWRLARRFFLRHWGWFAISTVCALLTSAAAVSYGLLVRYIGEELQRAVEAGDGASAGTGWIWLTMGGIAVAAITRAVFLYAMTLTSNTGVQRGLQDIQTEQFASLTDGDFARLASASSGGFVSRFINDINAIREAGLRIANNLTKGVVTVIGALAAMLWMDWQLTLVLLVAYPIAFGPVIALGNSVRKRAKRAQTQMGEVTSLLSEGFQSGRAVKAYGLEDWQKTRAEAGFLERTRLFLKVLKDKAAVDPILEVAGGLAIAGVLAMSAWRIVSGSSTIGDFMGFIALIGVATPELRALGTLNAVAQEGAAAAERVFEVLDAEPQIADAPDAVAIGRAKGAVAFQEVVFGYGGAGPVLAGLSFVVEPGETVALVGPSGAGKSTVFNLMLRLYDPSSGRVLLDGQDVRTVTGASLRAQFALVEQGAALFDDTVAANIALGRPGASQAEIEDAARKAHAHDFIASLAQGYATPVGEAGRNLSGGQRQRVALARAILRDAPVLLLDEATSALDAESEAHVQEALAEIAKDRTVIVIAHRLSTVRAANRILVMEEGRVVEQGSHDDLMEHRGPYRRLVELQLR